MTATRPPVDFDLPAGLPVPAVVGLPPSAAFPREGQRRAYLFAEADGGELLLVRQGREHDAYRLVDDASVYPGRAWLLHRLTAEDDVHDFAEGDYRVTFTAAGWACEGSNHSANGRGCKHVDAVRELHAAGLLG